jgi:hypothetical protein
LHVIDVAEEVRPMWEEHKRSRFQQLRERKRDGVLAETEQAELAILEQELEAAEDRYLIPATEGLRKERVALAAQNRTLENLTERKKILVRRLSDFLAEAQAERNAIECELAEVVAGSRKPEADK